MREIVALALIAVSALCVALAASDSAITVQLLTIDTARK